MKRKFVGEESQVAKRGVTVHITAGERLVWHGLIKKKWWWQRDYLIFVYICILFLQNRSMCDLCCYCKICQNSLGVRRLPKTKTSQDTAGEMRKSGAVCTRAA